MRDGCQCLSRGVLTKMTLLAYIPNMARPALNYNPKIPADFTVVDLIDGLGGPSAFAKICGFTVNEHARGCDMRRRQWVRKEYWPNIVKASYRAGYAHISIDSIFAAHRQ